MAEHPTIAAALIAAQQAFGQVIKNKRVSVGQYSYTYATLGDTLDAVMPALHENGLAILQPMESRDGTPGVITRLLHTSGETLDGWTPIITAGGGAQAFGSGISYARRYGLTALLCLAAEDDDGKAASTPPPKLKTERTAEEWVDLKSGELAEKPSKSAELHAKQDAMKRIHALRAKLGTDDAEMKEHMRETYRPYMPKEEFTRNMLSVDELIEYGDKLAAAAKRRGIA